ncbi:MAG: hypothetical protein V1901_04145 [Patescibacteria group bacterium]
MSINKFTPIKSIRLKCLECAGRPKDVRLCTNNSCPVYQYRLGSNPNRAGIGGRKPKIGVSTPNNPTRVSFIEVKTEKEI